MRVLIVDDEPLARSLLSRVVGGMDGVEVAGECADGESAVAAIRDDPPDLVLLDIQMPEVDGFEVVERVGVDRMPGVVFVTAHEQHTLRAFEVHALDYVMKPCDPARVRAAVEHARRRVEGEGGGPDAATAQRLRALLDELDGPLAGDGYATRITVRTEDGAFFLRPEEIDWLEASGNYVLLHVGEEAHPVRVTLRDFMARLDPGRFVRIHRSSAVNLDRVAEVHRWFGGDWQVVLDTGEKLRVSRTWKDALLKLVH